MLLLKSRQKILAAIARNPGIHVNALLRAVGSLRNIKGILNELEQSKIIHSKLVGNTRQLFPVLGNPLSVSAFVLAEEQEKELAEKKFPSIKRLSLRVDSFKKIFGSGLVSIVLFGSIARGHLTKESDIDVLFIVKKERTAQKNRLLRLFQTISLNLGREINAQIIEEKNFKKQLQKSASFAGEVQKERIILHNAKEFLSLQK